MVINKRTGYLTSNPNHPKPKEYKLSQAKNQKGESQC
jgi:hypothetical protein